MCTVENLEIFKKHKEKNQLLFCYWGISYVIIFSTFALCVCVCVCAVTFLLFPFVFSSFPQHLPCPFPLCQAVSSTVLMVSGEKWDSKKQKIGRIWFPKAQVHHDIILVISEANYNISLLSNIYTSSFFLLMDYWLRVPRKY